MTATSITFPEGAITASITPMHDDMTVNHELLHQHCETLLENGSDGILLLGTTGEANSLSSIERMEVLDEIIDRGFPPNKLMVGTGACALPEAIVLSRHAADHGVGGLLVMPPFYYKNVSDLGVMAWYEALIGHLPAESAHIYIYHYPKMSNIHMDTDLIANLADRFPGHIAGVKDSGGDLSFSLQLIEKAPSIKVYAGSEVFLPEILAASGAGCISATMNFSSKIVGEAMHQLRSGKNDPESREEMKKVREVFRGTTYAESMKGILRRVTGNEGFHTLRPPLRPLTSEVIDTFAAKLDLA